MTEYEHITPVPDDASAPAPVPEETAVVSRQATLDTIIQGWVRDEVRGSPIANSTEAWNHLQRSLVSLRNRIMRET